MDTEPNRFFAIVCEITGDEADALSRAVKSIMEDVSEVGYKVIGVHAGVFLGPPKF